MKYILFSLSLLVFAAISCKDKSAPAYVDEASGMEYFGEKITADGVIKYDELLAQLADKDSIENIKVEGSVAGVCQAKGCWMNIVSSDETKEEMFVKFKDYGFFMPKDIAGETVIMRGRAYKEETSVEELRHYAEDEGQSAEEIAKITEPVTELKFMADGVILKRG